MNPRLGSMLLVEATCGLLIVICVSQVHSWASNDNNVARYDHKCPFQNKDDILETSTHSKRLIIELISLSKLRDKLKIEIIKLEHELEQCRNEQCTSLLDKISALKLQKDQLQDQIKILQRVIKEKDNQISDIQMECDKKIKQLLEENTNLKSQIEVQTGTINTLRTDIEIFSKKNAICEKDLLEEKDSNKKIILEIENLKKESAKYEEAIVISNNRIATLNAELDSCKSELQDDKICIQNLIDTKNSLLERQGNLSTCQKRLNEVSWMFTECDRNLTATSSQLWDCNLNLDLCLKENDNLIKNCNCNTIDPCIPVSDLSLTNIGDNYYYFNDDHKQKLTWTEAKDFCHAHNLELISIETHEENTRVQNFIAASTNKAGGDYWISLNDIALEGSFVWAGTGAQVSFTDWRAKQPRDASGKEDCVLLSSDLKDDTGRWSTASCSAVKAFFVCEANKTCQGYPSTPAAYSGDIQSG